MLTERELATRIATNVAQKINLFSGKDERVNARLSGNKIKIDGFRGTYTLRGAVGTEQYSAAVVNDTHFFSGDGEAEVEAHLGTEETEQLVTATEQKVEIHINEEMALKHVMGETGGDVGNTIVLYNFGEKGIDHPPKRGDYVDYSVRLSFGVIFRMQLPEDLMEESNSFGYTKLHNLLRNCVVGVYEDDEGVSSQVQFVDTRNAWYVDEGSYAVNMLFEYETCDVEIGEKEIPARLKFSQGYVEKAEATINEEN